MNNISSGRHLILPISPGKDLADSIIKLCCKYSIKTGVFIIIGSTMSATLGIYDTSQQVWVTHVEEKATEIVSCLGNVTQLDGSHHVAAKIILADQSGKVTAGHLFSETTVAHAEIMIQEIMDYPITREYDAETSLALLDPKNNQLL